MQSDFYQKQQQDRILLASLSSGEVLYKTVVKNKPYMANGPVIISPSRFLKIKIVVHLLHSVPSKRAQHSKQTSYFFGMGTLKVEAQGTSIENIL